MNICLFMKEFFIWFKILSQIMFRSVWPYREKCETKEIKYTKIVCAALETECPKSAHQFIFFCFRCCILFNDLNYLDSNTNNCKIVKKDQHLITPLMGIYNNKTSLNYLLNQWFFNFRFFIFLWFFPLSTKPYDATPHLL